MKIGIACASLSRQNKTEPIELVNQRTSDHSASEIAEFYVALAAVVYSQSISLPLAYII